MLHFNLFINTFYSYRYWPLGKSLMNSDLFSVRQTCPPVTLTVTLTVKPNVRLTVSVTASK